MVNKQAFDQKMEALEALRTLATSPATVEPLRKALKDRNNYIASKAAAIVAELGLRELIPELAAAFHRFLVDPVKSDPQCWAKNAIAKALKDLDYSEADFYIGGLKHFQFEPVWGRKEDTAATLRGACALALVSCPLPRFGILTHLVEALASDPAKTVRVDAARAIAQLSGPDSVLLLRLKALCGDKEPDVVGQCFAGLLDMSPQDSIPFVAAFLYAENPDLRVEAAAVLGECHEPAAVATLENHWRAHSDPETRRAILLSLGASRHIAAADFLLSVIADALSEDAANAIRALASGRFREDYRERLVAAIDSRPNLLEVFKKEFN
jgi:HEAT repeat protein